VGAIFAFAVTGEVSGCLRDRIGSPG
jgi:hypothetical protein